MRFAIIALAATLGAAGTNLSAQNNLSDHIWQLNGEELDAVINGNPQRAASYFTSDAILLPPDGSMVHGTSAITSYWTLPEGVRLHNPSTTLESFRAVEDMAYLVGSYSLDVTTAEGTTASNGRFFMVWRRTSAGWKIEVDGWTEE